MSLDSYDGEALTEDELYFLQERIELLFHDKEGMGAEECFMLAYIQGMVECLLTITRPEIQSYEGAHVLLKLAKRAGGSVANAVDKKGRPDTRRN